MQLVHENNEKARETKKVKEKKKKKVNDNKHLSILRAGSFLSMKVMALSAMKRRMNRDNNKNLKAPILKKNFRLIIILLKHDCKGFCDHNHCHKNVSTCEFVFLICFTQTTAVLSMMNIVAPNLHDLFPDIGAHVT